MDNDNDTGRNCPYAKCKGKLVYRENGMTGEKFIGCSKYPECTHTEPLEVDDEI